MRFNSILNRYILREMLSPFLINLIVLLFIFLMTELLKIANYVVNFGVSLSVVMLMIVYTMPFFFQFVIPMSTMMAILFAFLRMSGDNETAAMKACGLSVYSALPPVLLFSVLCSIITALITIYAVPMGTTAFRNLTIDIAIRNASAGIKEKTFIDSFNGIMIYVERIDPATRHFDHVLIEDQRDKNMTRTIIAPKGIFVSDPENLSARMRLFDGMVVQVSTKDHTSHQVKFETYDLNIDLQNLSPEEKKREKHRMEMTLKEIRRYLYNYKGRDSLYYRTVMDYHKKFSIPIACIALGLFALPIGFQPTQTRRSFGIVLGLIFFLLYYLMLTAAWSFGKTGDIPPAVGIWAPNIFFGLLASWLLLRTSRDRQLLLVQITQYIGEWARTFPKRIKKILKKTD